MPLDPILIVHKRISLPPNRKSASPAWKRFRSRILRAYDSHYRTLDLLRSTLKNMGIDFVQIHRAQIVEEEAYKLVEFLNRAGYAEALMKKGFSASEIKRPSARGSRAASPSM